MHETRVFKKTRTGQTRPVEPMAAIRPVTQSVKSVTR
jgi:hypothetical protein